MQTRYFFGSIEISDREKTYIDRKLLKCKKLLNHYSDEELSSEIEIERDRRGFWNIVGMIQTPHEQYRVNKKDRDLRRAVDMLERALMKQIKRDREKIRDEKRKRA